MIKIASLKKIKQRSKFPVCIRYIEELNGICIGGCINKDLWDDAVAHAHCNNNTLNQGWICLKYKTQLLERYTLLHEAAHLIVNKSSYIPHHGVKWRKVLVELGGTYASYPSYNKNWSYRDYSPKFKFGKYGIKK